MNTNMNMLGVGLDGRARALLSERGQPLTYQSYANAVREAPAELKTTARTINPHQRDSDASPEMSPAQSATSIDGHARGLLLVRGIEEAPESYLTAYREAERMLVARGVVRA